MEDYYSLGCGVVYSARKFSRIWGIWFSQSSEYCILKEEALRSTETPVYGVTIQKAVLSILTTVRISELTVF
jgi:hypothetical protein